MTAVVLAANNGEIGGGEVMLLAVAEALRTLGHDVQVVAPRGGRDGVAEAARAAGFPATDLSSGRRQYIGELRAWRATNAAGILWCNGLVPAFATAGLGHRIVHLHQEAGGRQRDRRPGGPARRPGHPGAVGVDGGLGARFARAVELGRAGGDAPPAG